MVWDKGMSDSTTMTVIDDDNAYYEYHVDEDKVVIFNRHDEDGGEYISGDKAEEVKKFALTCK